MAKSSNERIAALREKIAGKQTVIEGYAKTLANTQKNIDAANKAIESYEKQISALEADMLAKALHKKGVDISEITAAIEAGLFDNSIPEKPPDKSENEPETKDSGGATYSTENTDAENSVADDKEDMNE